MSSLTSVGVEANEPVQPRMARTEIVDRDGEADLLIGVDDPGDMLGRAHLLILGELEDQPVDRQALGLGGAQGQLDTGHRRIDRIGQEVDRQPRVTPHDPRRHRGLDRLDPARLVEGIAIGLGHLRQNAVCALSLQPPDQRLIGEGQTGGRIHDRLKRHRERDIEIDTITASGTDFTHFHPLALGANG
ncbi:hypothetical protein QE379_000916 [Sphingomonas sp. SORGH_AS 879]|nr:hypothetical protein [Sphingomonas sp. SORGH_AS_0879]